MKNLLSIAVAAVLASPAAWADNTPDNVGTVTYYGNIVEKSPMWQWTVNDYPGGRLNAKPSDATTADGYTTYPLNGQSFIAVSGYLPSFTQVEGTTSLTRPGLIDKTTLTDGLGDAIANRTPGTDGAVSFTIVATGTNASGSPVTGELKLNANEVRGDRAYFTNLDTSATSKFTRLYGSTTDYSPVANGSCFVGTSPFIPLDSGLSGTAESPTSAAIPQSVFAEFLAALDRADTTGNAPLFSSFPDATKNDSHMLEDDCSAGTSPDPKAILRTDYAASAHILALEPTQLSFPEPVTGAWNATLNVTAYQM